MTGIRARGRCPAPRTSIKHAYSNGNKVHRRSILESLTRGRMFCIFAGQCLKSLYRNIDIERIQLNPGGTSPRPLGREKDRP